LGNGKLEKFIKKLFAENRVYYASNDVGSFVESYLAYISKIA
jgi:hypothetical protein